MLVVRGAVAAPVQREAPQLLRFKETGEAGFSTKHEKTRRKRCLFSCSILFCYVKLFPKPGFGGFERHDPGIPLGCEMKMSCLGDLL